MIIIQMFDEKICQKNNCPHINWNSIIPACFGNPENCKINQKAGFPKEIKKEIYEKRNKMITKIRRDEH